jgi:hypothetical protein
LADTVWSYAQHGNPKLAQQVNAEGWSVEPDADDRSVKPASENTIRRGHND